MSQVVLTLNAGSSSIKFAAFRQDDAALRLAASGQIEGLGATPRGKAKDAAGASEALTIPPGVKADHGAGMGAILAWLRKTGLADLVVAVGHRVVHGGPDFIDPIRIDSGALDTLKRFIPLAPLHEPHNIAGIEAAMEAFPDAPQIACFDTSFHRTQPFTSDTYGLPRGYWQEGVRRYGFHGTSYEYVSRRLREVAPGVARGNVIVAHLGNGASLCAMRDGRAVGSTMGFTALDGLPMGTRCGQIDPGVLLYLMVAKRMDADAVSNLLYKNSGLKGMSGVSQDMRELEASNSPLAREAIAYFVARLKREIGGLAALLGGADGMVFTAGIGEHSATVREAALADMQWMGVRLDREANRANAQIISAHGSPCTVFVIPTDEERMIAEHTVLVAGV